MAMMNEKTSRDLRIDCFRGLALVMIFVNHLPYSPLSLFTLRNWGLSDSAEVFVLLAGIAAALAYGRIFEQEDFSSGTRAVFGRIRTLYLTHLVLFVIVGGLSLLGATMLGDRTYLELLGYAALLSDPLRYIGDSLALMFQPGYLDILPLYVALLALVPLLILLARVHRFAPLLASLALYAAMQVSPLHLPNNVRDGGVWFFNPFAWQVLFVIGFTIGQTMREPAPARRLSPRWRNVLTALAAFYCALGVLVVGPWREVPGWENAWLVDPNLLALASKSLLHPLRLFDTLAKLWLVLVLLPASAGWLHSSLARPVVAMGRHSLPVFALSTVFAVAGGMVIEALPEASLSAAVNASGILLMLAIGLGYEVRRTGFGRFILPAFWRAAPVSASDAPDGIPARSPS